MLFESCKNSSIKYFYKDKYLNSIKLFIQTGEIYYVTNDRHLKIVIKTIPNWNDSEDMKIIDELNDDIHFKMCEGGKENNKYSYSIMLLKENINE